MAETIGKPKEEGKVTSYQAENIAIKSLEQAGFTQKQIVGNAEVKNVVEEFGRTHENQPRQEVEAAAEELRAEWESRKGTEFKSEQPAKVEEGEVQQLEQQEITAITPERRDELIREAREEARVKADRQLDERERRFGIKRHEPEKPDLSIVRPEIEEQKRKDIFAQKNPGLTRGTGGFHVAFREANEGYQNWLEQKKAEPSEVLFAQFLGERKPAQEAPAPQEAETVVARADEIVPVEEAPGEEEVVSKAKDVFSPKDLLETAFEEHGVDYKGFRAEYAKIMERVSGTSDPGEIAAANEEAAELTRNSLEQIRGAESEIRKQYADRKDVLAELNSRIGKIEGTVESSLARAAEYRAKIEAEPAVEKVATEVAAVVPQEAEGEDTKEAELVRIIKRNQADAARDAAAKNAPEAAAPEEVAELEEPKKKGEAVAEAKPKVDLAQLSNEEVIRIVESEKDIGERPDIHRGNNEENMRNLNAWMEKMGAIAKNMGVTRGELINRYDSAKRQEPEPVVAEPAVVAVQEQERPAGEPTDREKRMAEMRKKLLGGIKLGDSGVVAEITSGGGEIDEERLKDLESQASGEGVATGEERKQSGPAERKKEGEIAEIKQMGIPVPEKKPKSSRSDAVAAMMAQGPEARIRIIGGESFDDKLMKRKKKIDEGFKKLEAIARKGNIEANISEAGPAEVKAAVDNLLKENLNEDDRKNLENFVKVYGEVRALIEEHNKLIDDAIGRGAIHSMDQDSFNNRKRDLNRGLGRFESSSAAIKEYLAEA